MNALPRIAQLAVLGAAALVLAALVHLVLMLIIPSVATRTAFARLEPLGAVNATILLPRSVPDEKLLPYADPAVAVAFCRFDLGQGPVRIIAPTGRAFASVSFHTEGGLVFYALTDKAATRDVIEAVLASPQDIRRLESQEDEENPSRDLRVSAPAREGYVLMRVFSEAPSLLAAAEDQAKQLTCKPEPPGR